MRARRLVVVAVTAVAGLALSGCGVLGRGASGGGAAGYVRGDGDIVALPAAQRTMPGAVSGRSLTGGRLSLASLRGHVVVVNVWGSWCTDCRAEAPALTAAARTLMPQGVRFVGIDTRETGEAAGRAYVRTFHVPYPSIYDPDGRTLLAFNGTLPPNAIPSTVVLDTRGRVATIVHGGVDAKTLEGLVHDVRTGAGSAA